MLHLMLHRLQPSHGAVNFILAQLYVGVYSQRRFSPTTRLIRSLADAESTRRVKIMVEGLSTLHFPTALEPAQASLRQACASPGLSPVAGSVQWPCRSRHPTHCGSP